MLSRRLAAKSNSSQFQATATGAGAVGHWAVVNSLNSALCAGEVLRARSSLLILCAPAARAQHQVRACSDQATRGTIGCTRLPTRQQQEAGALASCPCKRTNGLHCAAEFCSKHCKVHVAPAARVSHAQHGKKLGDPSGPAPVLRCPASARCYASLRPYNELFIHR
jgi:hypothetical protein